MTDEITGFHSSQLIVSPTAIMAALGMPGCFALLLRRLLRYPVSAPVTMLVLLVSGVITGTLNTLLIWAVLPVEQSIIGLNSIPLIALSEAFLTAAVPEEFAKFVFALCVIWLYRPRSYRGVVLLAATVSLGFSAVENIIASLTLTGPVGVVVTRSLVTALHGSCGIIMGHFLVTALATESRRWLRLITALVAPILLHGVYDLTVDAFQAHEIAQISERPGVDELTPLLWGLGLMSVVAVLTLAELAWAGIIVRRYRLEQSAFAPDPAANQLPSSSGAARNVADRGTRD